ncbi:MAG: 2-dehydro-3-deoxygalactonokinase [Gammaproteobacteria bacterium]
MPKPPVAEILAADWGLSRFRLWALCGGKVIAETQNETGAAKLTKPADYETALTKAAAPWLPKAADNAKVLALICGMAGARDGWRQTPYRFVPCAPLADDGLLTQVPMRGGRIRVFLLPGLAQRHPPNVMRGEETQIAGLLAAQPDFDGAVCLPGSHAKWARVKGGKVRRFDTMMTGEIYALLSHHSALRHSVGGGFDKGANTKDSFDKTAFAEAADEIMRRPSMLAAKLFSVRAESILRNLPPSRARARLSGLCIGADIAAASHYCRIGKVAIIGEETIGKLYQTALTLRGIKATITNGKKAALTGLQTIAIHR